MKKFNGVIFSIYILVLVLSLNANEGKTKSLALSDQGIKISIQDSPPYPPKGVLRPVVKSFPKQGAKKLEVPTSRWTYGCSATAAGMLFGYYDRNGYPDMYTGPANDGVAPLINLGQGISTPITGSCSLIATKKGFDGRTTRGHVDDYWIDTNRSGPDPWKSYGYEHTWGDCLADYMGTNQWKWFDGSTYYNVDGSTIFFYYSGGSEYEDPIPPASYGLPQTALCHGMRLFAESRGYKVLRNYNQIVDSEVEYGGFSFYDYKSEINAKRPVLIHVEGHTMIGVGYADIGETVYLHDTWDNSVHYMSWGKSYAGMPMKAVTVFILNEKPELSIINPSVDVTIPYLPNSYMFTGSASDCDGTVVKVEYRINSGVWYPAYSTNSWSFNALNFNVGENTVEVRAVDEKGTYSLIESRSIIRKEFACMDYYTENFTAEDFDLDHSQLFYEKLTDSEAKYALTCSDITAFPISSEGTILSISDDESQYVPFENGHTFPFFNGDDDGELNYTGVFICSNGYLTFWESDKEQEPSLPVHFEKVRIAPFFKDLQPYENISYQRLQDRFVVTYKDVAVFDCPDKTVSFQVELFYNGDIRISYLDITAFTALAGISDGTGMPESFYESDLSL